MKKHVAIMIHDNIISTLSDLLLLLPNLLSLARLATLCNFVKTILYNFNYL
jgi:hypothetical protein